MSFISNQPDRQPPTQLERIIQRHTSFIRLQRINEPHDYLIPLDDSVIIFSVIASVDKTTGNRHYTLKSGNVTKHCSHKDNLSKFIAESLKLVL